MTHDYRIKLDDKGRPIVRPPKEGELLFAANGCVQTAVKDWPDTADYCRLILEPAEPPPPPPHRITLEATGQVRHGKQGEYVNDAGSIWRVMGQLTNDRYPIYRVVAEENKPC